jgi:hypothetical protein
MVLFNQLFQTGREKEHLLVRIGFKHSLTNYKSVVKIQKKQAKTKAFYLLFSLIYKQLGVENQKIKKGAVSKGPFFVFLIFILMEY